MSIVNTVRSLLLREQAFSEGFYNGLADVKEELDKQDLLKLKEQTDDNSKSRSNTPSSNGKS